jgi:hypothetical protein
LEHRSCVRVNFLPTDSALVTCYDPAPPCPPRPSTPSLALSGIWCQPKTIAHLNQCGSLRRSSHCAWPKWLAQMLQCRFCSSLRRRSK